MMDRLRDQPESPDRDVEHAALLVRSARLPEPSPERKARVGARVRERLAEPRGRLVPRPAFALIVVLLSSAAAASVTWAVVEWVREEARPVEPAEPPPIAPVQEPRRARPRAPEAPSIPALPEPAALLPATPPPIEIGPAAPAEEPPPLEDAPEPPPRASPEPPSSASVLLETVVPAPMPPPPTRGVEPAPPVPPAPAPEPPVPVPPASEAPVVSLAEAPRAEPPRIVEMVPPPDEEVRLVQAAFEAIRRDGRPGAAVRLVERYLARYPRGKLMEEALGLGMEAAAAISDARAAELAEIYIRRFPQGRFREAAARARARFGK